MNTGEKDIAYFMRALQTETKEKHAAKKIFFFPVKFGIINLNPTWDRNISPSRVRREKPTRCN